MIDRSAHERLAGLHGRRVRQVLIASGLLTLALYAVPFGRFVIYPLMLLSTVVHELGHGVVGLIVGGDFERFQMFADGSGVAVLRGVESGWRAAAVSAGGLVGPALVAVFAFRMVRRPTSARTGVGLLALAALTANVLVVRNAFGFFFVGAMTLALGYVALRRSAEDAQVALAFIAIQLGISVFSRSDYLFTKAVETSAGRLPSDVANMAAALGGPYWMWGALCGAFSVLVLVDGLRSALR